MSKRLQVLLPDGEMEEIQRLARRERIPSAMGPPRPAGCRSQKPATDPEAKLKAVRKAAKYSFPTADIQQMSQEIERGYRQ